MIKYSDTTIHLEKLRFYSFHGLLEHEKKVGNHFEVSLSIHFDAAEVMISGNLTKGINYAEVFQFLQREMEIPTELLESLVYRILSELKEQFPLIQKASISITKLSPPIEGFDGAGVSFGATAEYA